MIVALYPTIRAVAREQVPRSKGIRVLVGRFGMNENSARDSVDNFRKMLKGEKYQRINSIFQTEYYLHMIDREFGPEFLAQAVSAVEQHLAYYENLSGSKQPGIRALLETKYPHLLREKKQLRGIAQAAEALDGHGAFEPNNVEDAREWVWTSIARRQGQPEFRKMLLQLYHGRCAISGSGVEAVLEAAHILPYKGPKTNHPANGLLLRSDLHTLFDLCLIAVDTGTMTALVSPVLNRSSYQKLAGKRLRLPRDKTRWPSKEALDDHRAKSGL